MTIKHVAHSLVKHARHQVSLRLHVPLEVEICAFGFLRFYGGISTRDRQIGVIDDDVRPHLIVVGSGRAGAQRKPQFLRVIEVVVDVKAGKSLRVTGFRDDLAIDPSDRAVGDSPIFQILDAYASDRRAPAPLHRSHQIACEDLLTHIVEIGRYRVKAEAVSCRADRRTHLCRIKIAKGVVHRNTTEKRLVERELVVVRRQSDGAELCCSIQNQIALVDHLGALVVLHASLDHGISAEQSGVFGEKQPTRVCFRRVDGIKSRQRNEGFRESIDRGCGISRLEPRRRGQLQGSEQL